MNRTSPSLEVGQDAGEVALALDRRAGGDVRLTPISLARMRGQGGLAQAGRAVEQHVVERLAAVLRGRDRDAQVVLDPVLADVLVDPPRPQRSLDVELFAAGAAGEEAVIHA